MLKYYAKYRCLNCGALFVAGQGAEVPIKNDFLAWLKKEREETGNEV